MSKLFYYLDILSYSRITSNIFTFLKIMVGNDFFRFLATAKRKQAFFCSFGLTKTCFFVHNV